MIKFKELMGYWLRWILAVLIVSCIVLEPMAANAASKADQATTLAELRKFLKEQQAKKNKAESDKKQTQEQINNSKNEIYTSQKNIEDSEAKISEAKSNIVKTEEKIKELEAKTEEVMQYYQIMNGENIYLEFISNAKSMTELIMNIDAIEQVAKTNKEQLTELETMIDNLQKEQVDLKNYEKELEKNISDLESKIEKYNSNIQIYEDDWVSAEEEIESIKNAIKVYEEMGCKENEKFDVCASKTTNNTFLKPVSKGLITSNFGYRKVSGQSSYHSGIDIGLSEGTKVYSMVSGTVVNIVNKSECGGNKVYINAIVKGQKYVVVYLHLLRIDVKLGQAVTTQTQVGLSGGTSTAKKNGGYDRCTTGGHLHVSVSKGFYINDTKYRANLINPPGFPSKGGWFYSRTQWFGPAL